MKTSAFIILPLLSLLCACNKNDISKVSTPSFTVVADKVSITAGDTVTFTFKGNPNIITFYSGEIGHKYANINRTSIPGGQPTLQFSTFASTVGTQAGSLEILASTDFSGVYDTLNNSIRTATWIDLTSRAILSTGADNTSSGLIDISDIDTSAKTIWFAFRKHDDNSSTLKPWAWTIRSFAVNLYSPSDTLTYSIATLSGAGWYAVDMLNPTYKWTITSTALTIGGGGLNTQENEDWVITNPLNIYSVAPDNGVAVKTIDALTPSYSYVFSTPGVYTVTFVAVNQNVNTRKQVVKEMTVTVQ